MIRFVTSVCAVGLLGPSALAGEFGVFASAGWEDPTALAILGSSGNLSEFGYDESDVHAGGSSLFLTEAPMGGTPEAYVAYVTGLQAGDVVHASMWFKGEGVVGKGRLWGHYANDGIDAEDGTAGGATSYAGIGSTWEESTHTWIIPEGKTGLVIEARLYGYLDDNRLLGDDLFVGVSSASAQIQIAGQLAAPPVVPGAAGMFGMLSGFGALRRRRR
ncbi:MAG: hypothetical protein GY895_22295 [Phycisphaera sp.]|nr:hypothetical protein [Phycisphaera sp.]